MASAVGARRVSWRMILGGIFTIAILAVLFSYRLPMQSTAASTPAATGQWEPAGFTRWDSEVAYQWIDHPSCTYSTGTCSAVLVVTRYGCPTSLYGEVSLLDSTGTVIGFTNDTVGSVAAGQQAKLTFDTFKSASRVRLAKIHCY